MFEKHCMSKVVLMFVVYCDPSEPYEPISEWHGVQKQGNSNVEKDKDDYLCHLVAENEHVGVDEEVLYLGDAPINVVACCNAENDKEYCSDDDSEDIREMESESEVEVDEDILGHEADHIPNVEYDKEDPPMSVGTSYPSMKELKLALSQHAVKHEFEYNTAKSAPHRFRAYCSRRDKDKCRREKICSCFNSKHLSFLILAKTWILKQTKRKNMATLLLDHQKAKAWRLPVRTRESMPTLILQEQIGQELVQVNLSLFQLSLLTLKINQLSMQRPNQRPNQRHHKMPKRKQLFLCSHLIVLQWAPEARKWLQQALQ